MTPVYTLERFVSNPTPSAEKLPAFTKNNLIKGAGSNFEPSDFAHILIKDERTHTTKTHKDRSFRHWVSRLYADGIKEAALSSSGSSAYAAAHYCSLAKIKLHIFIRKDFPENAIARLTQYPNIILYQSKTPKKDAFLFSKKYSIPYLRASTDPFAPEGYKTLSFELAQEHPDIEEIFIPTSSGATLVGVYRGYTLLKKETGISMPRLYIVQTTMVHPMAEIFDNNFTSQTSHPARAIIDRIAHRKKEVISIIKKVNGGGYVISKEDVRGIKSLFQDTKKIPGPESLLAIAALKKHRSESPQFASAKSVCIFTS